MRLYQFDQGDPSAPIIHLAHANGFPPESYQEMVAGLAPDYRVICFPARPLWQPAPPPEDFHHWETMGDDLIAALEQLQDKPVIGIGHSMGGTATLFAAHKRPDLFSQLIMLDPVLFPRHMVIGMNLWPKWLGRPEIPLVEMALRRKRQWDSADAAFERFRSRSLFAKWSDEAIRAYLAGITQSSDDGGIELSYTPEWEAQIYRTSMRSNRGWWRWLKKISVPSAAIQGEKTDTFLPASAKLWQRVRPDFPLEVIADSGHLFPMEAPQQSAKMIRALIAQLQT